VIEAGTHSPWISRQLEALGHEVVVANPSAVYGRGRARRKRRNDRLDAEFLARQGRSYPKLLHPIRHRGARAQEHLELIRARDQLVRARTRKCSAEAFVSRAREENPEQLRGAVEPILFAISTR
jgi:transposase